MDGARHPPRLLGHSGQWTLIQVGGQDGCFFAVAAVRERETVLAVEARAMVMS
jgi:hypothetical protein